MNLYEIAAQYRAILEAIDAGEMTAEELQDTLEGAEGTLEDKLQNCVLWMREQEAESAAFKHEIDRLQGRKKVADNRAAKMKEWVRLALEVAGKDKVKTQLVSVSFGKPTVRTLVDNPDLLPSGMTDVVIKPRSAEIKAALESGKDVSGARLEQGPRRLTIR